MSHRRLLLLIIFMSFLFVGYAANEPKATISNISIEDGISKMGVKGINLTGNLKVFGMEGRKIGLWGYIKDDQGNMLSQGRYEDITFIDKVDCQNYPMVSVFIPLDNIPPSGSKGYIAVYDYSASEPVALDSDFTYIHKHNLYAPIPGISTKWLLPTVSSPKVSVDITDKNDVIADSYLYGFHNNAKGKTHLSMTCSSSYGYESVRLVIQTKDGKRYEESRHFPFVKNVLVKSIEIERNANSGDFHRISYKVFTNMPKGTKYALEVYVKEVIAPTKGLSQTQAEKRMSYETKEIYGYDSYNQSEIFYRNVDKVSGMSSGEIIIPTSKLKLNPEKDYIVTLVPLVNEDDDWKICFPSASSYLSKKR